MLGIIYILICFFAGFVICSIAFPALKLITNHTYSGSHISLNPYFVLLPAWYLTGTLFVTWLTYFTAYLLGKNDNPLKYANLIVMPIVLIISLTVSIFTIRSGKHNLEKDNDFRCKNNKITWNEIIFLLFVFLLAFLLMWKTFYIRGNQLFVGATVFSDFSPHLGMIRSFSKGNNFPTGYSHFAGEDIRYHFMFQFLAGNLEYLGLPLDFAFNIPSMISFISAFVLLYILTVKITGKRAAGYLACLFFAFRSSLSFYTYLSEIPKGTSIIKTLIQNKEFIGYTEHEEWGLWNLNVYCNQRHLAFSLAVIILVIILLLPNLYHMFDKLQGTSSFFSNLLLTKEGWVVRDYRLAIASGILLGSIAFWNGAALIAALSILFLIAVCSEHRLEYLIVAVIAVVMSELQASFFIKGSAISAQYYFGFLSDNPTIFGAASYLIKLMGILPIVLFAAFLAGKGVKRYLMGAFSMPLILAFTVSLTVDITVNHKYIMIAVMFLGILAADFLVQLFEKRDAWVKMGCVLLVFLLTGTGVYDFTTVLKKNQANTAVVLNLEDGLTKWIEDNSNSKDIFLTSNYALNRVVLGGAMLYQGWTYFAWSAGYDTQARDIQVKRMYEADTPEELRALVKMNHIRYIIVDKDNRISESYRLNEENIKNTFECVYKDGDGEDTTYVFDVKKEK